MYIEIKLMEQNLKNWSFSLVSVSNLNRIKGKKNTISNFRVLLHNQESIKAITDWRKTYNLFRKIVYKKDAKSRNNELKPPY